MRIFDEDNNKSIKNLALYLIHTEAEELLADLRNLIANPDNNHVHINDQSYEHELTVSIYTQDHIKYYDERSKQIIEADK